MPAHRQDPSPASDGPLRLASGSRVAVVGGGPAGSFFGIFLLRIARRLGLDLGVEIFEAREFSQSGPVACNMCGGVVSESLLERLAAEGISLPQEVVQTRIDSYVLHMDVGSVRIENRLQEKRIAAVHRGGGPHGSLVTPATSFDGYLMALAMSEGASRLRRRVDAVERRDGRPWLISQGDASGPYDLVAVATGVNGAAQRLTRDLGLAYRPPGTARAFICEFRMGPDMIRRYFGESMHVYLLRIPRLEFAAIIPKQDFVTLCLLGTGIDTRLVEKFVARPEVQRTLPPLWRAPGGFCRCAPRINVQGATEPFGDRVVFVGDCATTRLYKDGIGAAYRTAKAAATTAVLHGVSADAFRKHYRKTCRAIEYDNRLGRLAFAATRGVERARPLRRGLWRLVSREQGRREGRRHASSILWDLFTGSASYRSVLGRALHPVFLAGLARETAAAALTRIAAGWRRRKAMAKATSKFLGTKYRDGEVIFREGDLGDTMYVIQRGEVELLRRAADKEFCLAVLSEGEFFGELALFGVNVRPTTARAAGDVRVLTLERKRFARGLHEDPTLAYELMQKMAERIRDLESALVRIGAERVSL